MLSRPAPLQRMYLTREPPGTAADQGVGVSPGYSFPIGTPGTYGSGSSPYTAATCRRRWRNAATHPGAMNSRVILPAFSPIRGQMRVLAHLGR